ncbi:MAG: D-alanyl-D-alanine carboxypeptidase/D-alanyl-D-alanine-endopeptidase [Actinomycetota bacterium]
MSRGRSGPVTAAAILILAFSCTGEVVPVPPAAGTPAATPAVTAPTDAPTTSTGGTTASAATPMVLVRPIHGPWAREVEEAIGPADVSVAVGIGNRIVLLHDGRAERTLASTTKLLTSMTALEAFGPTHRFRTRASAASALVGGTLEGDLWLIGAGDPELGPTRLDDLAGALHRAGLRRITGGVRGDTAAFTREWWAPGWLPGVSRRYVNRTTALAFQGNVSSAPELAAAGSLTAALERRGVVVGDAASAGRAPAGLHPLASVASAPLAELLARQNQGSLNFHAETLAKALGAAEAERGSTAAGVGATEAWAASAGVEISMRDGSGLSYRDRATAAELVTMLLLARSEPWFRPFADSLAAPGVGTLDGRLAGVDVIAKTGTLLERPVSALAGYVRTDRGDLVAFAILSDGFGKDTAIAIEDAVVRAIASADLS